MTSTSYIVQFGIDGTPAQEGARQTSAAIDALNASARGAVGGIDSVDAALKQLGSVEQASVSATAAASQAVTGMAASTKSASAEIGKLAIVQQQTAETTRQANIGLDRLAASQQAVAGSSAQAARGMAEVEAASTRTGASLLRTHLSLVTLLTGFTIFSGIRESIGLLAEYDASLKTVQAVTKATAEEQRTFETVTRQLGATTEHTAAQAADALVFLARAGLDSSQSVAALPGVLNLATAAEIEFARAADIAVNTLAQFGLRAEETGRATDILVNTANRSNTSVDQLSEALTYAGPVAGAFGRSLSETAAAAGILSNAGIKASQAGTSLRGILLDLTDPTEEVSNMLARLGVHMSDLDPASHSLIDIFGRLAQAELSAGETTRIFGLRHSAAAVQLINNVDALQRLTKANEESALATQENANIIRESLAVSFKTFTSAVQEAVLAVGRDGGLQGALKGILSTATDLVRILSGDEKAIASASVAMKALAAATEGALVAGVAYASIGVGKFIVGLAASAYSAASSFLAVQVSTTAAGLGLDAYSIGAQTATAATATLGSTIKGALGFIAPLAGVAAAAITLVSLHMSRGTTVASEYADSIKKASSEVQGFESAAKTLSRAIETKDIEQQISAFSQQIDALKKLSIELRSQSSAITPLGLIPADITSKLKGVGLVSEGSNTIDGGIATLGIPRKDAIIAIESEIDRLSQKLSEARAEAIRFARQQNEFEENLGKDLGPVQKLTEELSFEADQLHRNSIEQRVATEQRNLLRDAAEKGITVTQQELDTVADQIRALESYRNAQEDARASRDADRKASEQWAQQLESGKKNLEELEKGLRSQISALHEVDPIERSVALVMAQAAQAAGENKDALEQRAETIRNLARDLAQLTNAEKDHERNGVQSRLDRITSSLQQQAAAYGLTRNEVERLALEEQLRLLSEEKGNKKAVDESRDRILALQREAQAARELRETTDAVAGGVGDFARALRDGSSVRDAAATALKSVSDKLFDNAISKLEDSISASLANLFGSSAEITQGDQQIVAAVDRVNASVISGNSKAAVPGGASTPAGTPGAPSGGFNFGSLAQSIAIGAVGFGLSLLLGRRRGGGDAGDSGGFAVLPTDRSSGANVYNQNRITNNTYVAPDRVRLTATQVAKARDAIWRR